MSTNIQCPYCPRYFSNCNSYSQHIKYCSEKYEISEMISEGSEIISEDSEISIVTSEISEVYDMSLDSEDYSQIKDL